MKLRVLTDIRYANLEIARKVLAAAGGAEVVEFSNGSGTGRLHYAQGDDAGHAVDVILPSGWLSDPEKAGKVEEAARHFSIRVRLASKPQPFSEGFDVAATVAAIKADREERDEVSAAEDRSQ
ncbi:MAG: hypothetical protein P4L99_01440 [Chthoniobacter sp.]|nr:hypothetical protein [Chthoniobacter sp.]